MFKPAALRMLRRSRWMFCRPQPSAAVSRVRSPQFWDNRHALIRLPAF
jgi:hypothetical protein